MKSRLAFLRDHVAPVLIAFGLAVALARLEFVQRFENVTLDTRTKLRAKGHGEYRPVPLVIGIDDVSIVGDEKTKLRGLGLWPWKRVAHGTFLNLAGHAHPAVIAWDILFTEPDVTEPINDETLIVGAQAAQARGTEVVFAAVTDRVPGMESLFPKTRPMEKVEGKIGLIHGDDALLAPILQLQEIAPFAAVDTPPDKIDGIRRTVPMVVRAGDRIYPSLSLQAVLRYWKVPLEQVRVRLGDGVYIPRPEGERRIPIDDTGAYFINYRFGESNEANTLGFLRMSAGWNQRHIDNLPVDNVPDVAGKILIVGQTSTGLTDMGPTPFSGHSPLVLVHANVVDNILREDFASKAPTTWIWLGGVALSIAGLATFSKRKLPAQGAYALGVPLVYGGLALLAWMKLSLWLPVVWPLLGFGTVQIFMITRRLILEQRSKAEIRGMFSSYLAPEVVRQLIDSGEKPQLGGHEKNITAYFSDIQGFSAFSEKLPPDRLVKLMNEYLTACTDIVQEQGGTLDKYIGDAVVAMFGAPIALPDHAYRACVATQLVHRKLGELRAKWKDEGGWPEIVWKMQSRIGLNSGECVIGNMGSRSRFSYTMMGDNVNLGSRMESGAKSLGVYTMCTEATRLACEEHGGDRVVFRSLGRIAVVGRSEPVPIFEITGLKEDVTSETRQCIALFEAALAKYLAQDWAGALDGFQQSARIEPNQPGKTPGVKSNPSLAYIDIVHEYQTTPPPPNWDGVYEMKNK